jgi:hypothetical protein
MCRAAADEGIFCRGFRRWPEREFHDRWKEHLGVSTHLTRSQMEELADLWQRSEQLRRREVLICDSQTVCPGACAGWNEFTDEDLERFCRDLIPEPGASAKKRIKRSESMNAPFSRLTPSPLSDTLRAKAVTVSPIRGEE